jgi:hypothetical protein
VQSTVELRDGQAVLVLRGAEVPVLGSLLDDIAGPGIPLVVGCAVEELVLPWAAALTSPAATDLAIVAEAVARAHDHDAAHGPFLHEHLRVGPVLLGWACPEGWSTDDDVRSFGELLHALGRDDVARRALVEDDAARPSMRALAAALRPVPTPLRPSVRPARTRPWRRVLLTAPCAALVVVALAMVVRTPRSAASRLPAPAITTATVAAQPTARPGDGVVRHGGHRWAAGASGDVVVVGDWDCDGLATPAVLRPATGQVWTYDRWPEGAEAVVARELRLANGGVSLQVRRGQRCDRLVVVDDRRQSTPVG